MTQTKVGLILGALRTGPMTNRQLCEVADEIPSYLSRTMAKLRRRGLVSNVAPAGRGHVALYALSEGAK